MMSLLVPLTLTIVTTAAYAQSGRKAPKSIPQPTPVVEEMSPENSTNPIEKSPIVTAEKNEDYRCTGDGSLARILDDGPEIGNILSSKAVDVRAEVIDKPRPVYTREASRAGVQGFVILRVELTASAVIGRVRVVRRLPYGLTENAIRVACKIKFKPAVKDGQQVSQWLAVEYAFRLSDPSVYRR